jgi:hypothetical protein
MPKEAGGNPSPETQLTICFWEEAIRFEQGVFEKHTTTNVSYTMNNKTPLVQRVLGTTYLKHRAIF